MVQFNFILVGPVVTVASTQRRARSATVRAEEERLAGRALDADSGKRGGKKPGARYRTAPKNGDHFV